MENRSASCLIGGDYDEGRLILELKAACESLGRPATVGIIFISGEWLERADEILELVRVYGKCAQVAGCSADGLIGVSQEVEEGNGISLLLLSLPRSRVSLLALNSDSLEEGKPEWAQSRAVASILLANPFSFEVDPWLKQWNTLFPTIPCLGGLAGGGSTAEEVCLFRDGTILQAHALVVIIEGGVRVDALVSQGCEPIGDPLPITGANQNVIFTLGGRPAYEVLDEGFGRLSDESRAAAQGNLFVGIAFSEYHDEFKRGDFLIRNIIGADPKTGAIAINAMPRVGQTLQFQLRDKIAAARDLRSLLKSARSAGTRPFASLMFNCRGRGTGLFQAADHDSKLVTEAMGSHACSGFFCNGEIGPVGGINLGHAYTLTIAMFCDLSAV